MPYTGEPYSSIGKLTCLALHFHANSKAPSSSMSDCSRISATWLHWPGVGLQPWLSCELNRRHKYSNVSDLHELGRLLNSQVYCWVVLEAAAKVHELVPSSSFKHQSMFYRIILRLFCPYLKVLEGAVQNKGVSPFNTMFSWTVFIQHLPGFLFLH